MEGGPTPPCTVCMFPMCHPFPKQHGGEWQVLTIKGVNQRCVHHFCLMLNPAASPRCRKGWGMWPPFELGSRGSFAVRDEERSVMGNWQSLLQMLFYTSQKKKKGCPKVNWVGVPFFLFSGNRSLYKTTSPHKLVNLPMKTIWVCFIFNFRILGADLYC